MKTLGIIPISGLFCTLQTKGNVTMNYWHAQFQKIGALWIHDGNTRRPHALLTSGNHSNGFFNASRVTEDPRQTEIACRELLMLLKNKMKYPLINMGTELVVGSAMGAITISHELGKLIKCRAGFTEKQEDGSMLLKRARCDPRTRILLCEDVMTTGGTTRKTTQAVLDRDGIILPYLLVLVNRSGMTELDGLRIVALIDHEMPIWTPEECPLCKEGSEAIRPKGNWDKLTGE